MNPSIVVLGACPGLSVPRGMGSSEDTLKVKTEGLWKRHTCSILTINTMITFLEVERGV